MVIISLKLIMMLDRRKDDDIIAGRKSPFSYDEGLIILIPHV